MISGKPVKSSIARTSSPASASADAVPPVDTSSTPSSDRPRAKSTMPRLSETDSSARWMRTAPGAVDAAGEVSEAIARGYPGVGMWAPREASPHHGRDTTRRGDRAGPRPQGRELRQGIHKLGKPIEDPRRKAQAPRQEAAPIE